MKIHRRFTKAGEDVFSTVTWTKRTSRITNADGSVVFEMSDAEVPEHWSQLATDIMVSKYFRKAGVPEDGGPNGMPDPGYARAGDEAKEPSPQASPRGRGSKTGPEKSAKQVIHRLAGCWRYWGEKHGYFDTPEDGQAFYDELCAMMLHQMAAPNSPQWFNTGLNWAYGITGPAQGHWITDPETGVQQRADDAYSHPQPHACFIQSVTDDLVNEGGIMDLWVREARLFKYGSGTGTNFSSLRAEGEALSGGGRSSGLMSFLKIGDRAAGAIKSGGTTRRAAKMVCLDADHPDIEAFVNWKVREELKVAAMARGADRLDGTQREMADRLGLQLDYDFNGEAYATVSGQNSNNSVRLTDAFFEAVEADADWPLTARTDGSVMKTVRARDLWEQICRAAWCCADPGVQFDTTINAWHTCPESGRINASNPCSEYMFLDDTACNLASLNLLRYFDAETRTFDVPSFEHAIELWTVVLEISVLMASFPAREIARQSYQFRTLGLGFANLGALLMQAGIPYDSAEGRALCAAIAAILTGRSYATSALMAAEHGPFPHFYRNRRAMLKVIANHRRAARGVPRDDAEYEDLSIRPVPIDHELFAGERIRIANAGDLLDSAVRGWDEALQRGEEYGFRNAQTTVIAPTGTIGLQMDCDTTGVEPDFALVKFKKLAGGGYFKIANASLRPALRALGYAREEIDEIITYVMGTLGIDVSMPDNDETAAKTFRAFLESKGYTSEELVQVENHLPMVFELPFAFNAWSMPEHVLEAAGVDPQSARADGQFNGLRALGLSPQTIEALNRAICGTQTVEGAPHLKGEHLAVFDCANTCGKIGRRFIPPEGHIRMMATAQPFISGAISKTINLPREATVDDIASALWLSWALGLKANALYRDGSKLSQPLSARCDADVEETEEEEALEAALGEVSTEAVAVASAISTSPISSGSDEQEAEEEEEPACVEKIVERIIERPMRRRLPDTRESITHRFNVAGHEGYLTFGLYEDGAPGELFITMSKEGSTIGGLMDCLGTAISVALQYGVPVESLVNKFAHQRFEPMGMSTNRDIPFAKSLVDYIFRWMGMTFIPGYREANAPQRSEPAAPSQTDTNNPVKEDKEWSKSESDHGPDERMPRLADRSSGAGVDPGRIDAARHTTGNGGKGPRRVPASGTSAATTAASPATTAVARALDASNAAMQSDAPACEVCGAIMVRNGTCYKCLNCGHSMGCS
ncbi:MAG: adenosylcobalamin-dependent ribonucleoside-diphosphate reductase [Planctomycetota bacterium]|nr:adenosylcobalamin-dependent ribonucleoside-diphosphate reductase [Planctomycetota bacterium]